MCLAIRTMYRDFTALTEKHTAIAATVIPITMFLLVDLLCINLLTLLLIFFVRFVPYKSLDVKS